METNNNTSLTAKQYLQQASPGNVGIREKLASIGMTNVVVELMESYSIHVTAPLQKEIEELKESNARICENFAALQVEYGYAKTESNKLKEEIDELKEKNARQSQIVHHTTHEWNKEVFKYNNLKEALEELMRQVLNSHPVMDIPKDDHLYFAYHKAKDIIDRHEKGGEQNG